MVDGSNKGGRRRRNGDFSLKPNVWRSKAAFEKRRKKRKDEQEMKKKKTKMTTTTNKNVVNDDLVVTQILTRLPAKSLMRFKSVCKPWKSTIEQDSHFISLHRTHSQARPPRLLTIIPNRKSGIIRKEDNGKMQGCLDFFLAHLDCDNDDLRGATVPNSWSVKVPSLDAEILGPLRGLLCFIHDYQARVYNFTTRQFVTPWIRSRVLRKRSWECELGFDPDTGEYKVIFVWHDCCEVLTVGVDSNFRKIDAVPPAPEFMRRGSVYANGSIYWMSKNEGRDSDSDSESLVAFDIGPEKFRMIRITKFTLSGLHPFYNHRITELDGCPAVVHTQTRPAVLKLWKFHDRDKEGSNGSERKDWSEVSIELPRYIPPWLDIIFLPIPDDERNKWGKELLVMNVNHNSFHSYNRVNKTFSKFEIQGGPSTSSYFFACCTVLVGEDLFPPELRLGR